MEKREEKLRNACGGIQRARMMVFPCVHCSTAVAVMNLKLLVFQDLKTYCVVGADAIGVALSSWKALRKWGKFIYIVRGKSFLLNR